MFDDFDAFENAVGLPVFLRIGGWRLRNLKVDGDKSTTVINGKEISTSPYLQWMLERLLAENGKVIPYQDLNVDGGRPTLKAYKSVLNGLLSAVNGPPLIKSERDHGYSLRTTSGEKVTWFLPPLVRPLRQDNDTYQLGDWKFRPVLGEVWLLDRKIRVPRFVLSPLMLLATNQGKAITYSTMNSALGFKFYTPRYIHERIFVLSEILGKTNFEKYFDRRGRKGMTFYPYPRSERL